jgi:HAD superfamily phosphatase (TIGR01668 family)
MSLIQPTRCYCRVSDIDVERDLRACGLDSVLLDIDNTLRSRADGHVPPDARAWLLSCADAGVHVCLLSNNWHDDVYDLADALGIPIVAKAMKPLAPGYLRGMRILGARARRTVIVGDQLLTDVVGARVLGLSAYLVAPLATVDLPHMAMLRNLERALLREPLPDPA